MPLPSQKWCNDFAQQHLDGSAPFLAEPGDPNVGAQQVFNAQTEANIDEMQQYFKECRNDQVATCREAECKNYGPSDPKICEDCSDGICCTCCTYTNKLADDNTYVKPTCTTITRPPEKVKVCNWESNPNFQ